MKLLDNEEVIWTSKTNELTLTNFRLRESSKSLFGGRIKSIMLEELTFSELDTKIDFGYLKKGVIIFILTNLSVFFLNNFLFDSELFKLFFSDFHIGPDHVGLIFYLTIVILVALLLMSIFSFRRTFSFYAGDQKIQFQLSKMSFEEREGFISMFEQAKEKNTHEGRGH